MSSMIFIYVGHIKMYLDGIGVGFYIIFRVAFIDRDMCQWDNCCRGDVSGISLLFCGKVGVY